MLKPAAIGLVLLAVALGGCSDKEAAILDSDANGYVCAKCGEKFFTNRNRYAEECPKCQSPSVEEVVGYVCPDDSQLMVAPKTGKGALCSKCGKFTNEKKLPSESELKAWGARRVEGKKD